MVQVGEKINSRQQLMIIPDMSTLQVKTRVYEAMVDQVQPGLEALIRLDAKPDLPLTGKVSKVGVLPDSQNRWLSPDVKVFNVIVAMDQRPEGLKPGMTAQVELMLARLENVLSVPVAAVFTEQEKTYCWRPNGGKPEMAPIKIGRTNDRRAEIVSGLEEGDVVLLSPPPGAPPPGKATAKAAQTRPAADNGPPQGAERRASGREGGPDEAPARASGREPGREEPTTRPGRSAPGESPASRPRGRRGPQEDRQP
jgi:multidrug efflux pump subunit AcrA (membrane-fusion protein)